MRRYILILLLPVTLFAQPINTGGVDSVDANFDSLYTKTSHIVTPQMFGAVANGVADCSVPVQNALQFVYDQGGGELYFPEGIYRLDSKIVIPNDSDNTVQQYRNRNMILRGAGAHYSGQSQTPIINSGTIFDLRYNGGSDYKMMTVGTGGLEITGITFANFGTADSVAFLKIIGTTTYIHHCSFIGTQDNFDASNDAIIFGGTYQGEPPYINGNRSTDSSAYAGYGSMVTENFFDSIRRMAVLYTWTNGVNFTNNTMWNRCGTNISGGGAWESYGALNDGNNPNAGGLIAGNLIEAGGYYTVFKLYNTGAMNFIGNNIFDEGDSISSMFKMEFQSKTNTIITSMHTDNSYTSPHELIDEDLSSAGGNAVLNNHQSQESVWVNPFVFSNDVRLRGTSLYFQNSIDNTQQFFWQPTFSASPLFSLNYYDTTGVSVDNLLTYAYVGKANSQLTMKGIGQLSANSDLKLFGGLSSNSVYLGSDQKVRVTGGVLYNTTTTGTVPFVISSTTPVDNLTVKRIATATFVDEVATDIDMGSNDIVDADNISITGNFNAPAIPEDTAGSNAGDFYIDPNSNVISLVVGATLLVNGDFTNWTGSFKAAKPDNWLLGINDTTKIYTEQSPTGQVKIHFLGDTSGVLFYQNISASVGVEYGYSFDVTQASGYSTINILGNYANYGLVPTIQHYSGEVTCISDGVGVLIYNPDSTFTLTLDNFKIWLKTGGAKEIPTYLIPEFHPLMNFVLTDTVDFNYYDYLETIDSIHYKVDDSLCVNWQHGANGWENDLMSSPDTLVGEGTLTADDFDDATITARSEMQMYFIYIGDTATNYWFKVYRKEER